MIGINDSGSDVLTVDRFVVVSQAQRPNKRYRARTDDRQKNDFTMVSFPPKVNHHKRQDKRDLKTQRFGCREPIEATSISSFM